MKEKLEQFLSLMNSNVPPDARIMMCQFRGDPTDPDADRGQRWRASVLRTADQIDEKANVYLCVSAMKKNVRGEFRRRKENFAGGLCLMIDDIGSGKGAKASMETISALRPTALIETSPDNFQAIYMFDELVTDMSLFNRLIHAFIKKKFLGKDSGMAGVNRVFRPPAGINAKAKHGNFPVRLADWNPDARYSPDQLIKAFDLVLLPEPIQRPPQISEQEGRLRFLAMYRMLRDAGMIRGEDANLGNWLMIECPWTGYHTGGADNGAGISEPSPENGWTGAFKCHHGSCEQKGWRDLTDWIADEAAEILELVNNNEQGFTSYEID